MIRYARRLLAKTATKCSCFSLTLAHRASGKKYIKHKLFITTPRLNLLLFLGVKDQEGENPTCVWVNIHKYPTHPNRYIFINPSLSLCRRCTDCANLRQTLWIFLLADGKGTNSYESRKVHCGHVQKPKEGEYCIA